MDDACSDCAVAYAGLHLFCSHAIKSGFLVSQYIHAPNTTYVKTRETLGGGVGEWNGTV